MKRGTAKDKKSPKGNLKISKFFLPQPKATSSKAPDDDSTIVDPTNLPGQSTPDVKKRKLVDCKFSPDIIPCSLSVQDQEKFNGTVRLPKAHSSKQCKVGSSPSRKIFEKSPGKLHQFNVAVIEKFVKITPTKKDRQRGNVSPSVSTRSVEVQLENERTPVKTPQKRDIDLKEGSKVKTKLNFGLEEISQVDSLLNDSWDDDLIVLENGKLLDLSKSCHCKILQIDRNLHQVILTLQATKDEATGVCCLEGFWMNMKLAVNDTLHITGVYDDNKSIWNVTNDAGLVVFEPDFLVSSTAVVGSLFCKRRSVLSERYKGFESSNRVMVVGILVHRLLQEVLKKKAHNLSEIEVIVKNMMAERDTIWMCYESCLEMNDLEKEVRGFVPRIVTFIKQYVKVETEAVKSIKREDWHGRIDKIEDIEENIWCPDLGIKGKVDVSVKTGSGTTLPLELKTSRASVSLEHRGQVILYIMMMSKFGYNVPSGLLLYLREGVLREVPATHKEKRDILLLRNELAFFLTRKPVIEMNQLKHTELPEPINHHNACAKCPYSTICSAHLKFENFKLDSRNPLKEVQEVVLSHLSPSHLDYFIKWSSLLALEGSHNLGNKQLHEIYTVLPQDREKNGQAIIDVVIDDDKVTECGGLYKHTFRKPIDENVNFLTSGIAVGNYVVVSVDSRPAVSSGFVTYMDYNSISISLDRNLNKRYPKAKFHLDTYNSSASQSFNMTSLALLLECSDRSEKLRQIIVDGELPTFRNTLSKSVAVVGTPILRNLNQLQQKAILKCLSCNDYVLIKGMPGTGKTNTIVALVRILVGLKKSILITSHTHSAVDNVCIKLVEEGINILRLGSTGRINSKLHAFSEEYLTQNCRTPEELDKVYNEASVLAVTCLGSGHSVLTKRQLDICIVDESTQVLQSSLIRALHSANKFVLVGDPNQLPPVVRNRDAISRGLAQSLFERLDNSKSTVTLKLNYRMNQPITDMANALTYSGELEVANATVANSTLNLPKKKEFLQNYSEKSWVLNALEDSLKSSVCVLNTGSVKTEGCSNAHETALVYTLVNALLEAQVPSEDIGVIAPYRAQVAHITQRMAHTGVEISTVDQFQGRDKSVILFSCSKSQSSSTMPNEFEILEDQRRLTVAITRAKHKFILIGDIETVKRYSPFQKLLNGLPTSCFINLEEGQRGFSWENVMVYVA